MEAPQREREPSKWPRRLNVYFALHTSIDKEKQLLRACNLHYKWSLCGLLTSLQPHLSFKRTLLLLLFCLRCVMHLFDDLFGHTLRKRDVARQLPIHMSNFFLFLFSILKWSSLLFFFIISTTRTFFWPLFLAPLKREICTRLRNSSLPLPSTRTSAIR